MTIALGILLAALAVAFVAWPLLHADDEEAGILHAEPDLLRERLEQTKREAYAAIRDAELDFHTGKLSDADLQLIRNKYEAQAIEAITALESFKQPHTNRGAQDERRYRFCPGCGTSLAGKSKFCPSCGAPTATHKQGSVAA